MKRFLVNFMKDGELFETIILANTSEEARNYVSIKQGIPTHFEIGIHENIYRHVGAVIGL